jgi:hypothetical protein
LLFVGLSKRGGENRSRLRKESVKEIFFVLFCFFVFWLVRRKSLEKVAPYRSLSLSLRQVKSLLFVFFLSCCSCLLFSRFIFWYTSHLGFTLGWVHKNKKKSSLRLCLCLCPRTQHARTSDIREQSMRVSERARENEKKTSRTRNGDI